MGKPLEEPREPSIRNLRPGDLDAVLAVDAKVTGRRREEFYKIKLAQALADTGIQVSLAADLDGALVGFLLSRVYYGEFGLIEPVAVLDAFAVRPDVAGHGVGRALMRQLRTNLLGLGIPRLQTEVHWDDQRLLSFFHHLGFRPAPRICLEQDLERARRREDALAASEI